MASLKKYDLKGKAVGELTVDEAFLDVDVNHQVIKEYIVALRANIRQWSANTKGRSEVNHTKKKPWKQKGTGNARQGSFAAPQFKGGGVVFGPKPKFDQHIRINRKERRLAIRHLLAEKIKGERIFLVEDAAFNGTLKEPRTQAVHEFLQKQKIAGRRVLFVGENEKTHDTFKKSMRNLPRCGFVHAPNVNGYDFAVAYGVVITESALNELVELLK